MKEIQDKERIKQLEEEMAVMKERYRILSETTPAILFEYCTKEDKMIFLYNFPENHKKKEIENYMEFAKTNPLVHPDHLERFLDVLYQASKSVAKGEIEYLSKVASEEFEWTRTYYSSIADDTGKVISVLGRIQNIHKSAIQKRELQHRTETDSITDLYEKGTAAQKINEWLVNNPTSEAHMIMIDIDNVKVVNDRYGHALGDEVLKEAAKLIKKCFGEKSILSRFGGDEFVIFLMDEPINFVESRVDAFMSELCTDVSVLEQQLNCSVGIAARVSRKEDFEDLFNRADNAMYMAKSAGKNRYYIYKEEW